MTGQREKALDALNSMRDAERRLAHRAHWSAARHFAFAALVATLVASLALPPLAQMLVFVGLMGSTALIVRGDRARDGMFVNGWRLDRTLWVTLPTTGVILALALAAVRARDVFGLDWAPLAAAAIVLPIGFGASVLWEYVYRRERGA